MNSYTVFYYLKGNSYTFDCIATSNSDASKQCVAVNPEGVVYDVVLIEKLALQKPKEKLFAPDSFYTVLAYLIILLLGVGLTWGGITLFFMFIESEVFKILSAIFFLFGWWVLVDSLKRKR